MADNKSDEKKTNMGDSIACGIDLGTTNSLCAWVKSVDPLSSPHVVFEFALHQPSKNPLAKPQRITPSIVGVGADGGELLVGVDAAENEIRNPTETVRSIKRLMGQRYDAANVVRLRSEVGYIQQDEAGMAVVKLRGKTYSPQEVSAMILRRIKADAEAHLKRKITHAVVSVPANFNDSQKSATREAARQAGFFVKRIVSEPVAATYGYGYGLSANKKAELILVFDMGGGTLDVCIVRAQHPLGTVEYHQGDMWLGGDDVDAKLVEAKRPEIAKQVGCDPVSDRPFMVQLTTEVRRAKEVLCGTGAASEALALERPCDPGGKGPPVKVTGIALTRAEVVEAARGYLARAMKVVEDAVSKSPFSARDIDGVILVGGSSYLLGIEEGLGQIFPPAKIREREEPIEMVALGCGVLACTIVGTDCLCGYVNDDWAVRCAGLRCGRLLAPFVDRTAMAYGIEVKGGGFEIVLEKGTLWPTSAPVSRTFYTSDPDQTRLYIPVLQGEECEARNNIPQGFVILELSSPRPLRTPVEVRMSVDRDGILEVEVECGGDKKKTPLKPGDWSTSLQRQVDQVRQIGSSTLVADAEMVIGEWQKAPRDSPSERDVRARGINLLERLRDLEWELANHAAEFLKMLGGLRGTRLPYVDVLDVPARDRIAAALERFRAFQGAGETGDRGLMDQKIWGAVGAVRATTIGECLFHVLLFGDGESQDPDHVKLARDRAELDVYLQHYKESKAAVPDAERHLESARKLLAAVSGRDYYVRVRDAKPAQAKKGMVETLAQNTDTQPMKG